MYEACCILYLKRIWSGWSGTNLWGKRKSKRCRFESYHFHKYELKNGNVAQLVER